MAYDVFISYSRKDSAIADKICKVFDNVGITYFIDRQGVGGGFEFPEVLANAILESKIVLFLASKNSYESKFTNSELTFAFNEKPKNSILPYIIDGSTMPPELRFIFSSINRRTIESHPIETTLLNDILLLLGRGDEIGNVCKMIDKKIENQEEFQNEIEETEQEVESLYESLKNLSSKTKKRVLAWSICIIISMLLIIFGSFFYKNNSKDEDVLTEDVNIISERRKVEKMFEIADTISSPYIENIKNINMLMVYVEGGTFTMGADEQDRYASDDEKPSHQVSVDSYYIGAFEVTQAQWRAIMGHNPSYFIGDSLPVESVSWYGAQEFCKKMSALTGKNYRLPTEAEWEYAARGGNKSKGTLYSGSNNIDEVAWYKANSEGKIHPVGVKLPNELGLYDMSGNVWEWCSDRCGSYSSSLQINPRGSASGSYQVNRGGCMRNDARGCRVSNRHGGTLTHISQYVGFRVVSIP